MAKRLKAHFSNNVWERRTAPPEDWNKPLPDHLADAAEDSLLRDHAPLKRIKPFDITIQEDPLSGFLQTSCYTSLYIHFFWYQ